MEIYPVCLLPPSVGKSPITKGETIFDLKSGSSKLELLNGNKLTADACVVFNLETEKQNTGE